MRRVKLRESRNVRNNNKYIPYTRLLVDEFPLPFQGKVLISGGVEIYFGEKKLSGVEGVVELAIKSTEMEFKEFEPRFKSAKIRQNPVKIKRRLKS